MHAGRRLIRAEVPFGFSEGFKKAAREDDSKQGKLL
jgi:hypothetical protein